MSARLRFRIYQFFSGLFWPTFSRLAPMLLPQRSLPPSLPVEPGALRFWFHAASVGELEALIPVMAELERQARDQSRKVEWVVSVFSPSAHSRALKIAQEFPHVVYSGYCPFEGQWNTWLTRFRPEAFVTVKYEAWPELWDSLAEKKIPLLIVSATWRPSLARVGRLLSFLGARMPELSLLTVRKPDTEKLGHAFPSARLIEAGEPRWDRVAQRASKKNARLAELAPLMDLLPRPFGVLGSFWPQDLKIWKEALSRAPGTLWIVPHKIDPKTLEPLILDLEERKNTKQELWARASEWRAGATPDPERLPRFVLLDEMGMLAEFYSVADWVYVGGGFTSGVHSTIEPALQGLPIAIGPKRADRFPEIHELVSSGQVSICRSPGDLFQFLDRYAFQPSSPRIVQWKAEAQARLGASKRIAKTTLELAEKFGTAIHA